LRFIIADFMANGTIEFNRVSQPELINLFL
jgi:hypothetical protein